MFCSTCGTSECSFARVLNSDGTSCHVGLCEPCRELWFYYCTHCGKYVHEEAMLSRYLDVFNDICRRGHKFKKYSK